MAPIQLQNGHKEYPIKNEHSKNGQINKSVCSVCGQKKPNDVVDLSTNEVMQDTLVTYYKMSPVQVKGTLSALCVQCVYKINIQREMARTLELRLHHRSINFHPSHTTATNAPVTRLTKAKSEPIGKIEIDYSKTSTTCKTSPKHCHNASTIVPEDANFYTQNNIATNTKQRATPIPTITTTATRITPTKNVDNSSAESKAKSNSKISNNTPKSKASSEIDNDGNAEKVALSVSTTSTDTAANNSMLEVICERSESALMTESGGYVSCYPMSKMPQHRLVCSHCDRSYLRKDFYKKHVRRCMQKHPYAKTTVPTIRTDKTQSHNITKDGKLLDKSNDGNCNKANKQYTTPTSIARTYYCAYCDDTRDNLAELRLHQLTHLPQLECRSCDRIFNSKYAYDFHKAECNSKQEALKSAEKVDSEEESKANIRRKTRSVTRAQTQVIKENDLSLTDDCDDGFSVADSMFTQRMHTTCDWIQAHRAEQFNCDTVESVCNFDASFFNDPQIASYKEYDIYLLELFKLQVQLKYFRCFEPNCKFRANDLFAAILHDYKEHWNRSWYFCRKCDCMFTKKVHLDYHLYLQNSGHYICYKCAEVFLFQYELDCHLIRHSKSINYRCNYCQLEFLTELQLLQHCDIEQHNPNTERTLVCIDSNMTITNEMLTNERNMNEYDDNDGSNTRLCHNNVRIIDMSLPKMRTKRSTYQNNRHVIGDFEFKNQIIPNCAGCKYED